MKTAKLFERLETERTSRAIERRQALLETTMRSIADAVIATDANGRVTLMNPVAEGLTGWSELDARGRFLAEVFSIVDERTREEMECPFDKVMRETDTAGLSSHGVLLSRDRTKATFIEARGVPIRGARGSFDGIVVVFRDTSTRWREETRRTFAKQTAAALSESFEYEVMLARVARLAVPEVADWCTVDVQAEGETQSKQVALAHVDPAKVRFAHELRAKYPSHPNVAAGVPNVLQTGVPELYEEIPDSLIEAGAQDAEHVRLLRELHLCSAMIVPFIARGRVLGAMSFAYADSDRRYGPDDLQFAELLAQRCALAIDNARLHAAEVRARKGTALASEAKDQFLAAVSHELRTPLTAIMGWVKLLASPALGDEKKKRALHTIERNAVAMAELIDDLLDTSRGAGGRLHLERQIVDLTQVLRSALEIIRPAAEARNLRLTASIATDAVVIIGDSGRLQQVFWNLLSNAVKFTPQGGAVDVTLERLGTSVEIRVTDSGRGIGPAFLPYIFDPFRQESSNPYRGRGGLGLGLAITRRLLELHGGHIVACSDGEGCGTTFKVTLPVRPLAINEGSAAEWCGSTSRRAAKARDLNGIHVLVVDDQDDARDLIRTVLETCGADVDTAGDVDQAMQSIDHRVPNVLISDIGMPGQDGYDLIRKVRQLPIERGGGVPAAALSAYARTEDRRRALEAGYSMHLAKPIEPAELIDVVASLTGFSTDP